LRTFRASSSPIGDAVVSRTVLPIPPAITAEMTKGFTLWMMKAVFNGRGDVDLAISNLGASRMANQNETIPSSLRKSVDLSITSANTFFDNKGSRL
jgi:hypothetical protein